MLPHWIVAIDGGPRRVNHSAVVVGHRIFMFGGYCMREDYTISRPIDAFIFNTYTNRWTKIPLERTHRNDITQIPCMRYGHCSVDIGEVAYLWGGRNDIDGDCDQLFTFNTSTLSWKKHPKKGNCPAARDGHAMCVVNGNIYMFGGFEEEANKFSNEMYMLEVPSHVWHRLHYKNGEPPTWRDFHTLSALDKHIYVFGGRGDSMGAHHSNSEVYDSTLKFLAVCFKKVFDTEERIWYQPVSPLGCHPCGRRSHSAFTYRGCFYIFGGYNSLMEKHFNDVWKYSPESRKWTPIETVGTSPKRRRRQCCCMYKDRLYVFGGTSPSPEHSFLGVSFHQSTEEHYEENLHDHDDMHVLDFAPSLQTLCLVYVNRNNIDISHLPPDVRWQARMMVTPNSISKSSSHHG